MTLIGSSHKPNSFIALLSTKSYAVSTLSPLNQAEFITLVNKWFYKVLSLITPCDSLSVD